MICYKGKVLTVDSNDTVAGFLVEDKGRIVYVGNELPEQYKNVQTVELGKKVLVPAFVDYKYRDCHHILCNNHASRLSENNPEFR